MSEHVELDYEFAATAWYVMEVTKATMRYRDEMIRLGETYASELALERARRRAGGDTAEPAARGCREHPPTCAPGPDGRCCMTEDTADT